MRLMERKPRSMEQAALVRKIIHVDMDAFYASVEQRDNPAWKGKPIAVGGSSLRGVVAAASYEARHFGVRSAMPSVTAARLCPDLIFVKPRFEVYRKVSLQIREIFFRYTDLVEPLSLDEAYLDVTHNKPGISSATQIAREICQKINQEVLLTASAGISVNKFLAKIASDIHKPRGITLIPPDRVHSFLEKLPIEKFHGIGDKTAEKMKKMGIHTGKDLKSLSEFELAKRFGKVGRHYFRIVRGMDERPVVPNRLRKSVGAERTFSKDLSTPEEMETALKEITEKVADRLQQANTSGKTLTLKIKFHDFTLQTRSKTQSLDIHHPEEIYPLVCQLLHQPFPDKPVRLLGVSLSNLSTAREAAGGLQLTLDF